MSIIKKSVNWESSCSMRTDGRTDIYNKGKSWFSQFCELRLKVKEIQNFTFNEAYIS
jgi:hypothetical protein